MNSATKLSGEISVLLVDDHPIVRDGYRVLLGNTADIRVIGEAESGEQAYQLYGEIAPDVVILDLNMPGMGGLELIRRLLAKKTHTRVLVFSMHDSQVMVQRAREAGAAGYLTKSSASSQMAEAVRQVAAGKTFFSHDLMPEMVESMMVNRDPVRKLSQREFQVFRALAEGHTVAEIADTLCISPKTVGVHQTHIMKKLGLRNAAELVRLAVRCRVLEP